MTNNAQAASPAPTSKVQYGAKNVNLFGAMPETNEKFYVPENDSQEPVASTTEPEPATASPQEVSAPQTPTHDWEKRYSDLKSHADREMNVLKAQMQALQQKLEEKDSIIAEVTMPKHKAPLSDEEFDELSSNFKNIDDLAHTRALRIVEEQLAPYKKEIDKLKAMLHGEAESKAKESLRKLHPDFEQLQTDPEFISWYQGQPKKIQELISSETSTVAEIARGLDFYKKDKGIKTKQEKQLEASLAVKVDAPMKTEAENPNRIKYSDYKRWTPQERMKRADEVNKAIAEGRFDYTS